MHSATVASVLCEVYRLEERAVGLFLPGRAAPLFEKPDPRIKLEAKWVPKFQQNHRF